MVTPTRSRPNRSYEQFVGDFPWSKVLRIYYLVLKDKFCRILWFVNSPFGSLPDNPSTLQVYGLASSRLCFRFPGVWPSSKVSILVSFSFNLYSLPPSTKGSSHERVGTKYPVVFTRTLSKPQWPFSSVPFQYVFVVWLHNERFLKSRYESVCLNVLLGLKLVQ